MWHRLKARLKACATRTVIFAVCAVVTCVFFINLCNAIYRCGCGSLWAGADAHCNVHNPTGKHCPWCAIGGVGQKAILAGMLLPQAALSFWPAAWSWPMRLILTLAAFPAAGGVLGLIAGWMRGYWN
jgi:hypothetical protein